MAHPACSCPCSPVSFLHLCASCRGQATCLDDDEDDGKQRGKLSSTGCLDLIQTCRGQRHGKLSSTGSLDLIETCRGQDICLDDDGKDKDKAWQAFQHWELLI